MHKLLILASLFFACKSSTPSDNETPDVVVSDKSSKDASKTASKNVSKTAEPIKRLPMTDFQRLVQEECACAEAECRKAVNARIQQLPLGKLRSEKPEIVGQLLAKRLECSGRTLSPEEVSSLDSSQAIVSELFAELCIQKDRESFDKLERTLEDKLEASLITKLVRLRPAFFGKKMKERNDCIAALSAKEVENLSFRFKVPTDYELIPQYQLKKMSEGLSDVKQAPEVAMSKPKTKQEYFKTSVVFTKIPVQDVPAKSKELCDAAATAMAEKLGVETSPTKRLMLPLGETCQFELEAENRLAVQTVVYLGSDSWTVTCNFDRRDTSSRQECDEVLHSFAAL